MIIKFYLIIFSFLGEVKKGKLKRIIDGDTYEVIVNDSVYKVRLVGINTPEIRTRDTLEKRLGYEVKRFVENYFVGTDSIVYLLFDVQQKDKYNRLLCYVFTEYIFINLELVKLGYAKVEKRFNFILENIFKEYENRAKKLKLGIWLYYNE